MTDLAVYLERLGLEQYLDAFVGEGFDTWETLLDVQESDLETLGVKLGHRRKLQRAIAEFRGISYERPLGSPAAQEGYSDATRSGDASQGIVPSKEGAPIPPTETKRKYRRHPKPDENAPEKPPSAYVLFSNKVREEVKAESLSFTEIAKLVGDRWQKLEPPQKEPFESQATALKEQYTVQLSAYKKTESYKEYTQYLSDFKAKHGPQTDAKRPKLNPQSSGGSLSAASADLPDPSLMSGHGRVGSISSVSAASHPSAMASPQGASLSLATPLPNIAGTATRNLPSIHRANSPQPPQFPPRERRLIGQMSNHSSTSDDSGQVSYDPLSRAATTLSLNTPPTGTPPLPTHALGAVRLDQGLPGEGFPWPSRGTQPGHQQGSLTPSGPSPLGTGITLPSPTFPGDARRERGMEWTRQPQTSPSSSVGPQTPVIPLPPLLGPDRMSELSHSQAQRTLPPLRHNAPPSHSPSTYQGSSTPTQLSRQVSGEPDRRYPQSYESGNRQGDRNANEAANTLAGLAARPGHETPHSRSHSRRGPQ